MSRPARAGEPGKQRSFRATDAEWTKWKRAAEAEGDATVSAWAVKTLNERAERVAPNKARRSGR